MTLSALGIFSAAGVGAGASSYERIATAFGTGSSGVITFSSIPSDYKNLQIRFAAKNTAASGVDINFRMNGIVSSSYSRHHIFGNGSGAVTSAANSGFTNIDLRDIITVSGTTGLFATGIIDILDYTDTSKNTTIKAVYGSTVNTNRVYLASGALYNTAAITSISLTASANNFATPTRFSLYGIRG